MKTRVRAAVVLMAFFVMGLCAIDSGRSRGQEREKAQARARWEYKVLTVGGGVTRGVIDEKQLIDLGKDGWELHRVSDGQPYVASSMTSKIVGLVGKPDTTITTNTINYTTTVYYLKRPK